MRLNALLARFRRAEGGVAAVEFALLLPVMLFIWFGMVVTTDALNADRKKTVLTRTLSDLSTQFTTIAQADLDSIFEATSSILWPRAPGKIAMRLTSIDIDGASQAWVDWSGVPSNAALRGTFTAKARCTKVTGTVPAALLIARTSLVLAEVEMTYQASVATQLVDELFGASMAGGSLPLSDKLYMRPRQVTKVTFNPAPGSNCPGYTP